jgi:tRNA A-37 threonylcarbamoyl transferase component Bud32
MIALDALYRELIKIPLFRDARSRCRASYGEYFVKLCRLREKRFLLRNEARYAQCLNRYDFCPPFVGFQDFDDASILVYRRVVGVSLVNVTFATKRIVSLVSKALDRVNDVLASERICQLDPSPNNIIVNSRSGQVWYVDYELCAPFGTEIEITNAFGLSTDKEKQILSRAFQTAACHYRPASMTEYGDAFNRYMNKRLVSDLERRRHLAGILKFFAFRLRLGWQQAKELSDRTSWG